MSKLYTKRETVENVIDDMSTDPHEDIRTMTRAEACDAAVSALRQFLVERNEAEQTIMAQAAQIAALETKLAAMIEARDARKAEAYGRGE